MSVPASVVDKVLGFVDRPWKILAVCVLALVGVVSWTLWEKRAQIAETILEDWTKPRLEREVFTTKFAEELLSETRGDLVLLAEISLSTNLIKDIEGFRRADPAWRPPANPRPIFYADRDPQLLIGLMEGHPICGDVDAGAGEEQQMLAALGVKRRCYIAVPPVLGVLVGGLMVAWRQPLPAEAEQGARRLMYQAATRLATW